MKKITLLLSSLFFFSLGTSACSDEAPSGNTEKPELPVNPEPPVTPSETLKGSFESKFVRYAKGQKFTGQEDDRLVTTVWKDTVWQNERVHKQIVLWTESKRYDDLTYEIGDLLSGGNRIASSNLHLRFPSYVLGDEKALVCKQEPFHLPTHRMENANADWKKQYGCRRTAGRRFRTSSHHTVLIPSKAQSAYARAHSAIRCLSIP